MTMTLFQQPSDTASQPAGRGLALAMLHSPLRFLLGPGICELSYTGRRSRRLVRLPVQYARDGGLVAILAGRAQNKTWWRNFTTVQPVHLSIAGGRYSGTAVVAEPATPEFNRALATYLSRFPNAHYRRGDRLVAVSIQPDPAYHRKDGQ